MSAGLNLGPASSRSLLASALGPMLAFWQRLLQQPGLQSLQGLWQKVPEPLQVRLRQLGWPGVLASLLSVWALLLLLWALPSQERALQQQREALNERRLALQQQSHTRVQHDPQTFVRSLPADSERQARTAALLSLAPELGLPWPRSEFRYQAEPALGVAQYRLAMTVQGNYEQIRRYVQEGLQRDPALGLESVKLRRLRPSEPSLSAELTWVLSMQMPQPLQAPPSKPPGAGVQP